MTCPELSPTLGGKTYAEWLAIEEERDALRQRLEVEEKGLFTEADLDAAYAWWKAQLAEKEARIEQMEQRLAAAEKWIHTLTTDATLAAGDAHSPECWKNAAVRELGVGGRLASCTCKPEGEGEK